MNEIDMHGYDTLVQCKKCGKKQYLNFINGLKNGWDKCCGETMIIIKTTANIDACIGEIVKGIKNAIPPADILCPFDETQRCVNGNTCKKKCLFILY